MTSPAIAADGAKLHHAIHGSGPIRIALTHSLAMNGDFWRLVIAALGDKATVLTWDCRGHGASDKPPGPYTVELFADDLAAVFDEVGWDKAIVGGASMGGTVALAFALRHPERVTALALFDTTASYGPNALAEWRLRAEKAAAEGLASMVAFQQTRWFSDGFRESHADVLNECAKVFCANDIAAYGETCLMLGSANLLDDLSKISAPTSILVGEEDYATPLQMAETLNQGIAGSTIEVIRGARHLTPLESPELVAARLMELAERVKV